MVGVGKSLGNGVSACFFRKPKGITSRCITRVAQGLAAVFMSVLLCYAANVSAFDLSEVASFPNNQTRFFDLDGSGKLGAVYPDFLGISYLLPDELHWGGGTYMGIGVAVNDALATDLNADGKIDLVTANQDGNISVILKLSDGEDYYDSSPANYATTATPSKIWALDLNGDGYPEIITLNSGSVSMFTNDTSGSFGSATGYVICSQATEMHTADLDGDSAPDLVFPCYGTNSIDILRSGSGYSRVTLTSAQNIQHFFMADFSGSGRQDLFAAGLTASSLFRNAGGGSFDAPVAAPPAVGVGDWDGDGNPDLGNLYSGPDPDFAGFLQLYRNTGGVFETFRLLDAPRYSGGMDTPHNVMALADVNGDAIPDILLQGGCVECGNAIAAYFGTGGGEYAPYVPFSTRYGGFNVTDFDADGRPDIILHTLPVEGVTNLYRNIPGSVPRPFSFMAQTGVDPGVDVFSEALIPLGISSAPISVIGGEYSINDGDFTSDPGILVAGDSVRIRVISAEELGGSVSVLVNIGPDGQALSATFRVTTTTTTAPAPDEPTVTPPQPVPPDTKPDSFRFIDVEDAGLGQVIESNPVGITGINAKADVTISGGEYRIEGSDGNSDWTNIPGQVDSSQRIRVRLTSAEVYGAPRHVTLSVGGVTDTFTVTTTISTTVTYIPDTTGLVVPMTVPIELLPASQNQRLPQTRCATAETRPAAGYRFPPLTIATLGQSGAPIFQTVEITVPEAFSATGKGLAPTVIAGAARIAAPPGAFILSVSPCGRADGGYFRTFFENEMAAAGLTDANAALVARRRDDGRLEVAVEQGSIIYRAASAPPVSTRQQRAGVLPSTVGQNVRLYTGEVGEFDSNGRLLRIRLGTLDGQEVPPTDSGFIPRDPDSAVYWWSQPYQSQLAPAGDQVAIADPRGRITFGIQVPALDAPAARLDGLRIDQAVARTFAHQFFGAVLVPRDPYRPISTWGLRMQYSNRLEDWVPVGPVRVEPGRPDNAGVAYYGLTEIAYQQTVVALAPALPSLERFARAMRNYFGETTDITLAEGGVIIAEIPGPPRLRYALRPRHAEDGNRSCQSLSAELNVCNGLLAWKEPGETRPRGLYPAFASFSAVQGAILDIDPNAVVSGLPNGEV